MTAKQLIYRADPEKAKRLKVKLAQDDLSFQQFVDLRVDRYLANDGPAVGVGVGVGASEVEPEWGAHSGQYEQPDGKVVKVGETFVEAAKAVPEYDGEEDMADTMLLNVMNKLRFSVKRAGEVKDWLGRNHPDRVPASWRSD